MPILSARYRMSRLSGDIIHISECADKIVRRLKDRNLSIAALSSYIPGLVSNTALADQSQDALLFLVRLAGAIQERGHPCRILELVAGSLIDGVWPAKERNDGSVYVGNILDRDKAIEGLLVMLKPIAEEAAKRKIVLALELEPGPNFILNDIKALDKLCRSLSNNENTVLSSNIGLNLDVAHWSLAGITLSSLLSGLKTQRSGSDVEVDFDGIVNRVVHSHFSDHGPGHFADVALGYIHDYNHFKRWYDFICNLATSRRPENWPSYSGFTSLELEAVKSEKMMSDSLSLNIL